MSNATIPATWTPAEPATITHEVLVRDFGHSLYRDQNGCWNIVANPNRCGKWGEVPEADYEAAYAAERAPTYGCRPRAKIYRQGRYVSTHEHWLATGEDLSHGYHEQIFIGWE